MKERHVIQKASIMK